MPGFAGPGTQGGTTLPNMISDELALENSSPSGFEDTHILPETEMMASPARPTIESEESEPSNDELMEEPETLEEEGEIIQVTRTASPALEQSDDSIRMYLQEIGKKRLITHAEELQITVEKLREITKADQEPVSLETPIGKEEDSRLGDIIRDQHTASPPQTALQRMLCEDVNNLLETHLTERERYVVRRRFGLDGGQQRTLEGIGHDMGVTRERVRQIEAKALNKLRMSLQKEQLRGYLS